MVHELSTTQTTSPGHRFRWERELLPTGVIAKALKKKTRKFQATVNLARALTSFARADGTGIFASESTIGKLCGIKEWQVRRHLTLLRTVGALETEFRWNAPLRYRLVIPASADVAAHPSTTAIRDRANTTAYQEEATAPLPLGEHDQGNLDHLNALRAVGGGIRPRKRLTDDQARLSIAGSIQSRYLAWAHEQELRRQAEWEAHRASVVPTAARPLPEYSSREEHMADLLRRVRGSEATPATEPVDQVQEQHRANLMELLKMVGKVERVNPRLIADANSAAINYFQRAIYESMSQEERNNWYLTDYRDGKVWTFPEAGVQVA